MNRVDNALTVSIPYWCNYKFDMHHIASNIKNAFQFHIGAIISQERFVPPAANKPVSIPYWCNYKGWHESMQWGLIQSFNSILVQL